MITIQAGFRRARRHRLTIMMLAIVAVVGAPTAAAKSAAPLSRQVVTPGPPMGWSSWYGFGCGIDAALFKRTARTLRSNGMAAAGYRYVNIDDCWSAHARDYTGNLVPNPRKFPQGIAGLAAYVHARGLKLGIYLDSGGATCTGFPGSQGHYYQDARTIASWGVDYAKVDFCRSRPAAAQPIYEEFHRAFAATRRPIALNICDWGYQAPWTWGPGIGISWRTTGDYFAYGAPASYWHAILKVIDLNAGLASYAQPGAYNDPNALLIGTGVLSVAEERSQLSLWSMLAAPLIAGGELDTASHATVAVLTNRDVIAVDQDPAAMQGMRLVNLHARQIWLRQLGDGSRALLLLNAGGTPSTMSVDLTSLGLPQRQSYTVRDLWAHRSFVSTRRISARIAPHDVGMYRIRL